MKSPEKVTPPPEKSPSFSLTTSLENSYKVIDFKTNEGCLIYTKNTVPLTFHLIVKKAVIPPFLINSKIGLLVRDGAKSPPTISLK